MTSNFFPVEIPSPDFAIGRTPFDEQRQQELKRVYNADNSFFRHGGHTYVSRMGERAVPGLERVRLSVDRDRRVVGSLLRHTLFRTFRDAYPDIVPLTFYPFRIHSRKSEHDLVAVALRNLRLDRAGLDGRVGRRKLIGVQLRDVADGTGRRFGFVVNVRYSWTFGDGATCETLVADGLELAGREVLLVEPIPGLKGVLAPAEALIGTVKEVGPEGARVETNSGVEIHPLSRLIPRRTRRNVDDVLGLYIGEHRVGRVWDEIRGLDTSRLNAKRYAKEVGQMARTIAGLDYRTEDGFEFSVSDRPYEPKQGFRLEDPVFRFDYNPGASERNASAGLIKYGPYDSLSFEPKTPRVAILCHGSARDAFTSFLGKLRDGIPEARYFSSGMRGKYRLQDLAFDASRDFIEVNEYSGDEYERLAARYLAENDGDRRADLVLIQTREDFKARAPGQNPYFRAKARFMMAGVPTQFLKANTIRRPDGKLQYTIDSVALQSYAKLGGVPYVLPAGNNVDREIVVGIGHSVVRSNAFRGNEQDRVVGITTFFKADGQYLYGTRCREVTFDGYFDALLDNLRASLETVASDYGWRDGDSVRLVFHVFKPIRAVEAEVVARLVSEYPQYNVTFAFVTVNDRHPFVLFDPSEAGKWHERVGEYVPKRRTNWVLDGRSCLVQLTGAQEMSTVKHGFSTPVLVKVHESSTYRDLHAIVQQVFNFSFLSWRTFKPSRSPVTIDYASLIADKLSKLRKVEGWQPEAVNATEMKRKKWFL